MKTKTEIIAEITRTIQMFAFRSKEAGRIALDAKRKYEAAGPGDWHFDYFLRYRSEARNWGKAASELRKAVA